jgi:hypothetical protein
MLHCESCKVSDDDARDDAECEVASEVDERDEARALGPHRVVDRRERVAGPQQRRKLSTAWTERERERERERETDRETAAMQAP